ncbi:hypothetical protein TCON_0778 [Astathelohania contejeani]|uniref:Uncharacterized protein n=1 Tax=Astathelohania contejeani TaxID=164912 RepID=A0ABQ7I0T5_9MICR|nr:hypothetical protein TCON_0778 [Thelohania contejeani]
MNLKDIYNDSTNMEDKLINHIKQITPCQISEEISELDLLSQEKNLDLKYSIFLIEVLSKVKLDRMNLKTYIKAAMNILENKKDLKYAIYSLRILNALNSLSRFIPLSGYIINLLKQCKKGPDDGHRVDWNTLKVVGTPSMRFIEFVQKEAIATLTQHIHRFSNTISFPEFSFFILKELKKVRNCPVEELIEIMRQHADFIRKEREPLQHEIMDNKKLTEFENRVKKMNISN